MTSLPITEHPLSHAATQVEGHHPVMLREVMTLLQVHGRGTYLDGTFGGGGYTRAIMKAAPAQVFALDRDPDAITRGKDFQNDGADHNRVTPPRFEIRQGNFRDMATLFADVAPFDGIVLDLGVSSFQIDQAERGFSFRHDGPLDMRMSQSGRSAADLVNESDEAALADIIYYYGEERLARRVARAIVSARQEAPIKTTGQLAAIIRKVVHPNRSRIDPATRSFQAIRIAVNDEMNDLERALDAGPGLLKEGGRLVVVTFHSLEDRLVKRAMHKTAGRVARPSRHLPVAVTEPTNMFRLPQSKPSTPSDDEIQQNPRARSAKIRVLEKTRHIIEPLEGTS